MIWVWSTSFWPSRSAINYRNSTTVLSRVLIFYSAICRALCASLASLLGLAGPRGVLGATASYFRPLSSWMPTSLLIFGLFLIFWALDPYLRVLSVSCLFRGCGDTVTIMHVLEFPPRDSDSILVNFESLYGICEVFGSLYALISLPKVDRLWLILLASLSFLPLLQPVLDILSEPAKSTRYSFPF